MGRSESGTGTSASSHSSAEATSTESSATSASEDERTSASSSPSAIIVIVRLLAAYHLMATVTAGVGYVFRSDTVAKCNEAAGAALQFVLAAFGTFGSCVHSYDCEENTYRYDTEKYQKDATCTIVISVGWQVVLHRTVQACTGSTDAGHHAFTPSVFLQIRYHMACLDAFANSIGQGAFQPITSIELDASLVGNEQDYESVVLTFLSYSP